MQAGVERWLRNVALLFPVTVKLREAEAEAINSLVAREPFLSRAEALIGASLMGLSVVAEPDGFQRLLGILRQRRQGEEVLVPKKPPASETVALRVPRKAQCA